MRTGPAVTIVVSLSLLGSDAALADSIPLIESSCGPESAWLCYYADFPDYPEGLETTFDTPIVDYTIDPVFPEDADSWRLISVSAGFNGSAYYAFIYPDSSKSGYAQLQEASFTDSTGRQLLVTGRGFAGGCFENSNGAWQCSDGDIMQKFEQFGEVVSPIVGGYDPSPDPDLPSLAGPIVLRFDWAVYGDEPTYSVMAVNAIGFGYILAPIPEPSTALLFALGLAGLGLMQRSVATKER